MRHSNRLLPHPSAAAARRVARLLCAAAALGAAGCTSPRAQAAMVQELNDAANEIGGMKSDIAQLQTDVDSLRQVVAKQDTVISRLVEVTHVPR